MNNKIVTFVIVIMSYILEWKKVVASEVNPTGEGLKFSFPNTNIGRTFAKKLRQRKGFENCIIILTNDHGTGLKLEKGIPIVLMSVPNPNPVITATISAPDAVEGKAKLAESIRDKGASTTYVTIPPGQLLAFTPLIANLRAAVGEAQVDYAWDQLNTKLKLLMRIIQDAMDANKPQSLIICVHYGYHAQGRGGKSAQIFGGETGAIVGSIDLHFPIGPRGCCYSVKFWNAARTSFSYALGTDIGHGHFDGLVSGEMQNVSVVEVAHGVFVRESQIIAVRAK